ncbi:MAG: energy transducer TonB [Proteobacteria bacterium]|nr:energy transducer TonB [Pseudomonadota bacterium]
MNGQISPSASFAGGAAIAGGDQGRLPAASRLIVALLASCLLHGAAVILPYLGSGGKESRLLQQGGQQLPRALTATLAFTRRTPLSAISLSRQGDRYPESPVLPAKPADASHPSQPRSEGADLLPIPAPSYYGTDQLSKRPQPLAEVKLDTPEISPIIASGKMILKLWINERGEVIEVEVEKTELPDAFSRAAITAFKQLHFIAGERHGQPVGSVMRIEVSYVDGRSPPP